MRDTFFFQLHTRLHYGVGQTLKINELLDQMGAKRVLILADEGVAAHSDYYLEIVELIRKDRPEAHGILLRGTEEPDYDYLDEVAGQARSLGKLDAVIGIGGGSCLDIMKAVAVLLTNPGQGIEYRGFDKVLNPGVPTIAIPTTAGTGSEVTINAVFTDKKEMRKLGINGRYLHATHAVLDARWTQSCPPRAALSAGMDALVHALESFMAKQATPLTRVFSREAFRVLYRALPCLSDEPTNIERRQELLLGAYLAGAALFNSGSGISGAFSYPLGVHYKIPHGIAGGIFIASVVEYNVERGYTDYAELLDLIEPHPVLSAEQKSRLFTERLQDLTSSLGVPQYLTAWGVTMANFEEAAKHLLALQAAFDQNPVAFSADKDARWLLAKHIE